MPLDGEPSVKDTGPEPAPSRSATLSSTCCGNASVTITVSVSVATVAGLVTMIVYSTIAPGIAFGLLVPLTGSEITVAILTRVRGTDLLLVQVHVTEPAGMVMVRLRPVPTGVTVVPSPSLVQASETVYPPGSPLVKLSDSVIVAPAAAFAVASTSVEGAVELPATALVPPPMVRATLCPAVAPAPQVLRRVTRPPTLKPPLPVWVMVPSVPSFAVTLAVHAPVGGSAGIVEAYS